MTIAMDDLDMMELYKPVETEDNNNYINHVDIELKECRKSGSKYICIIGTNGNVLGVFVLNNNIYNRLYLDRPSIYNMSRSEYSYIGYDNLTTEMELLCLKNVKVK